MGNASRAGFAQPSLRWWHALATATAPFGFFRERAGGVLAPAVLHALGNDLGLLL